MRAGSTHADETVEKIAEAQRRRWEERRAAQHVASHKADRLIERVRVGLSVHQDAASLTRALDEAVEALKEAR